jgi:FKBP-type peptidyl-prolyl cis-trans isomerase
VTVTVTGRVPATTGREGEGLPYFPERGEARGGSNQQQGGTLTWVMGDGRVPAGLEEAVASLAKGERAIVSCPASLASGGDLLPAPPSSIERVEFELELLSMLQVRGFTHPWIGFVEFVIPGGVVGLVITGRARAGAAQHAAGEGV